MIIHRNSKGIMVLALWCVFGVAFYGGTFYTYEHHDNCIEGALEAGVKLFEFK